MRGDEQLNPAQLAAMQSLDEAWRARRISRKDAEAIEDVIRRGHVHGARKRLTAARREHASRTEPADTDRA